MLEYPPRTYVLDEYAILDEDDEDEKYGHRIVGLYASRELADIDFQLGLDALSQGIARYRQMMKVVEHEDGTVQAAWGGHYVRMRPFEIVTGAEATFAARGISFWG